MWSSTVPGALDLSVYPGTESQAHGHQFTTLENCLQWTDPERVRRVHVGLLLYPSRNARGRTYVVRGAGRSVGLETDFRTVSRIQIHTARYSLNGSNGNSICYLGFVVLRSQIGYDRHCHGSTEQ